MAAPVQQHQRPGTITLVMVLAEIAGILNIVAGVFADVGPISLNPHHIAARQVRIVGMCNHPSRGYPASMKLLEKFKDIYPLRDFVTHRFKVDDAAAAMTQVQDLNACMKVVITP